MRDKSIGVFDSGVGGITVLRALRKIMPDEKYIYFGDTGRLPYGYKPREVVIDYSVQISRFLRNLDVKALVIACNTANALAGEILEEILDIPVIGVIKPAARRAISSTKNKRIGVIGTKNTIDSNAHKQEIERLNKQIQVYSSPMHMLVSYIEEGQTNSKGMDIEIQRGLEPLLKEEIDTLILGCTHYPLVTDNIGKVTGSNITLINPAADTALELYKCLFKRDLLSKKSGRIEFYTTGKIGEFTKQLIRLGLSDWYIKQVGITDIKDKIFVQKGEEYSLGKEKK